MNIDLHLPMARILTQWLASHIKECQPSLCSEFFAVNDTRLFSIILRTVIAWDTHCFLIFTSNKDVTNVQIVDGNNLRDLLEDYFVHGVTVAIVDPTNGDGCTIDWEGYEDQDIESEILIVAWGRHESVAQSLVDEFGSGDVFRGN